MKFLLYIETGVVSGRREEEIEIDDDEYNAMTRKDRKDYLDKAALEYMHNMVECGWEEVKW